MSATSHSTGAGEEETARVVDPEQLGVSAATTPGDDGVLPVGAHWSGFGGAHGGLLVAAAAQSMAQVVPDDRALRSLHADLQGSVAPGTLTFAPELDRAGRVVSFARTTAQQDGRTRLTATGVFGAAAPGIEYPSGRRGALPEVPGPEDCETWFDPNTPALKTIEYRPAIGTLPGAGQSREALMHVWVRVFDDPEPVDVARALILLDAPAPGLFATLSQLVPIPTVELSAHLMPALEETDSPWALARMQTVVATDGYAIDDCELWSPSGALLAMARQLRRVIAS